MVTTTLLCLAGCGQTGRLYLPTEPAATNRATLPESLWPVMPKKQAESTAPDAQTPSSNTPVPSSETVKP